MTYTVVGVDYEESEAWHMVVEADDPLTAVREVGKKLREKGEITDPEDDECTLHALYVFEGKQCDITLEDIDIAFAE